MGFTNTSVVTGDDAGYEHLQRPLDGYERLRRAVMEMQIQPWGDLDDVGSFPTPSTSTMPTVTMASEEVESEYLHTQNQSHEYLELVDDTGRTIVPSSSDEFAKQLESLAAEDEYTSSRTQSCIYEEIPVSLMNVGGKSGNTLQQGYVTYVDYSETSSTDYESLYSQLVSTVRQDCLGNHHQPNTVRPVSVETKDDSGSTSPKNPQEGYVDVVDYSKIPVSLPNQTVSMETEEDSAYSDPQNQHEGYVGVVDYRDSFITDSESFTASSVSMEDSTNTNRQSGGYEEIPYSIKEKDNQSGNNIPKNQWAIPKKGISKKTEIKSLNCDINEGYVDYVDYTEWQDITNEANPSETDEEAEYTCPQSRSEGYVGMVDLTCSVPPHFDDFSNKATSMEIERQSLQAPSDGYQKLQETEMMSDESGYTPLRCKIPEYLEILGEPETHMWILLITLNPFQSTKKLCITKQYLLERMKDTMTFTPKANMKDT